ncbi:methylated-DNA--protein-cysteine methyltransferase Ogt [Peptoclostridium acidaminophilum DSM 3953]|uniref:Methylated-DNA--protein-cysteine methyltransferase n=1 Tax=Peptoclostridium acidaminophilum DSM 3953 TaxID=1286171 RepID=W8T2J3_PEPAC|nr:methylated-DNA--[protein]-cysteine S-methyltransferase [Peptoclostridium acidaminophilum]AHM55964.1 methylated-DNA--protein-cysteine methyltransferase Ogt [Peptoclostridium acidaminophilum DSM 3953]
MKKVFFYDTAIGRIGIAENGAGITDLFFDEVDMPKGSVLEETELLKETAKQLKEYLEGERKNFELLLCSEGTKFQKKVWEALESIPYGETRTYKQIAEQIGNPKACRAVGMANNKNPISIIIPCHRVIGSNGRLVGYGGGIEMKKKLIDIENQPSKMSQI